jgi:hypothetical protein
MNSEIPKFPFASQLPNRINHLTIKLKTGLLLLNCGGSPPRRTIPVRTEKQKEASRANGRRSHGPNTPEGKATSALNALRHGLLAKCVVLPHENRENFQIYLDQHVERFQVADQVEMNVVEDMVSAAWRLRRNVDMQTTMLEREMASYDSPFAVDNLVAAFNKLANEPGLRLLQRYDNSLHR